MSTLCTSTCTCHFGEWMIHSVDPKKRKRLAISCRIFLSLWTIQIQLVYIVDTYSTTCKINIYYNNRIKTVRNVYTDCMIQTVYEIL